MMMSRHRHFWSKALLLVSMMVFVGVGLAPAQAQPEAEAEVAFAWFDLQLQLAQTTPGFSPPVVSRAFAYTGVTLYEALVPGAEQYQTLAGQLNGLTELPQPSPGVRYHWPTVANSALATITRFMYPNASAENKAAIDALYNRFADTYARDVDEDVFARSVTQGRVVADAIYIWSLTDGGHEGHLRNFPAVYVPLTGTGMWRPTPRRGGDPQSALLPYWGNNRPFALKAGDECAPAAPPPYSEDPDSAFYAEAMEVYETVNNLTMEQNVIASYWSDDPGQTATPGGHSLSITTLLLRQQPDLMLAEAGEVYAKVGIAVADAFIGCWNIKYKHNLLRPVTYIQAVIDPDWMPPLTTPPFPEYPSGHSVQSGAVAQVLTATFGEYYAFHDNTHEARGFAPRLFESFLGFADEAAMSRLYGGIHYRAAIEEGIAQGRCIGDRVNALAFYR